MRGNRNRFVQRNRSLRDSIRECWSHKLKPLRFDRAGFFDAVNLCDVRVVERHKHVRFALEPRNAICVATKHMWQHLDRDVTIQARLARAIHLAHAARAHADANPQSLIPSP
jgi:hypothetical protein